MLGRGKIGITLPTSDYVRGDTISGTITLTLDKPMKARELSITLIGEYTTTVTTPGIQMGMRRGGGFGGRSSAHPGVRVGDGGTMSTTTKCTMRYSGPGQQLDSEKEYGEGQQYYSFEMKIPADILNMRRQIMGRPKWHLLAKLDIPHGPDINKEVKITIR